MLHVVNRSLSIQNWPGNKQISTLSYQSVNSSCANAEELSRTFYLCRVLSDRSLRLFDYYFLLHCSYVRQADNFYDATVLNAGHMVPTDQPVVALELIDRFIRNTL